MQEIVDLVLQPGAVACQFRCRTQDLGRAGAGLLRCLGDTDNVRGNLGGSRRRLLHVAGNFLRRRALFLDGRGDDVAISLTRLIVPVIEWMASAELPVESWMART